MKIKKLLLSLAVMALFLAGGIGSNVAEAEEVTVARAGPVIYDDRTQTITLGGCTVVIKVRFATYTGLGTGIHRMEYVYNSAEVIGVSNGDAYVTGSFADKVATKPGEKVKVTVNYHVDSYLGSKYDRTMTFTKTYNG